MVTPKKSTAKPKAVPAAKNTSAPATPEKTADVSVTEAAQAASQAAVVASGNSPVQPKALPPAGEEAKAPGTDGDGHGAKNDGAEPVARALIISAQKEGFRRAGRAWSKSPTEVAIDEFSDAQVEALLGESMLSVTVVAD